MKDKRTKIIEELIDKNWPNKKAFAENINIPYTTLRSMLARGIGNATVDNVLKVCKGLGITTEQLEKMANGKAEKDNNDITTIAAHHDGEDWTEEELEEIERFKEFIRTKRQK